LCCVHIYIFFIVHFNSNSCLYEKNPIKNKTFPLAVVHFPRAHLFDSTLQILSHFLNGESLFLHSAFPVFSCKQMYQTDVFDHSTHICHLLLFVVLKLKKSYILSKINNIKNLFHSTSPASSFFKYKKAQTPLKKYKIRPNIHLHYVLLIYCALEVVSEL